MHWGKVDPGVSELPRGNELSRDHVNRPLDHFRGRGAIAETIDVWKELLIIIINDYRLTMKKQLW